MTISLILARARNGVIGHAGGLPWKISADMKNFKAVTMGKPIVMGRKTWDSIGRPLPGRANIVISTNPDFRAEGTTVVSSVGAALTLAETMADATEAGEVMVIGGAEIYKLALPLADRIYLTEIHKDFEGDTFFPSLNDGLWKEVSREDHEGTPAFSFVTLERN